MLPSIVDGHAEGDRDSCMRRSMGMGTILKIVAGIGIRVPGTVGDEYKYLSPCSVLQLCPHKPADICKSFEK